MFAFCVICYNVKHPAHPERSFHRFPKNEEVKNKWIEAIKSHCPASSGMICSDHFLPEDFCEPVGYGYVPKRLLQDNAVPKLKIIGFSMTDIRLQQDNIKEDVEQRVIVHPLDSSEKENIYRTSEETENSPIKQPELDLFDFFTQSSGALSFDNENIPVSYSNEHIPLSCGNENIPLQCDYENISLNSGLDNIPLNCGNENVPLNYGNENISLNCSYENIPLNCGNENIPSNDGNKNITDPDLKRIIGENMDTTDLTQECSNTAAELNSTKKKKDYDLETKLKRVVIKMPDIGLRSFTEDDFTSSLAWKIFVKFILHNRKEISVLKYRSDRYQQKIESYQKMFEILRKGGRIRMGSKS